jgi:hypothetical protein
MIDFTNMKSPWSQSTSWSGLQGDSRQGVENTLGQLTGDGMNRWNNSLTQASAMPGQIDQWASDRIKQQRLGADDWYNAMSGVARQRAGQGVLGGTETQALRGNTMSSLISDLVGRQDAIRDQANQQKLSSVMSMPQMYGAQAAMMPQLGGLLKEGYTQSYSEDPAAMANVIARLIISGYTG